MPDPFDLYLTQWEADACNVVDGQILGHTALGKIRINIYKPLPEPPSPYAY